MRGFESRWWDVPQISVETRLFTLKLLHYVCGHGRERKHEMISHSYYAYGPQKHVMASSRDITLSRSLQKTKRRVVAKPSQIRTQSILCVIIGDRGSVSV